jgi:hypothetical protein
MTEETSTPTESNDNVISLEAWKRGEIKPSPPVAPKIKPKSNAEMIVAMSTIIEGYSDLLNLTLITLLEIENESQEQNTREKAARTRLTIHGVINQIAEKVLPKKT